MFFVFILFITTLNLAQSLPIVDKGVFVITGVKTCGAGSGYCVLGGDCSVDKEFAPDPNGGHCDGLRKAFTPRAYFVCCEYVDDSPKTTTTSTTTSTTQASTLDPSVSSDEGSVENDSSPESKESSSVESSEHDKANKTKTATTSGGSTTIKTTTAASTALIINTNTVKPVIQEQQTNTNLGVELNDDGTTTEKIAESNTLPNTNTNSNNNNINNNLVLNDGIVPSGTTVINDLSDSNQNDSNVPETLQDESISGVTTNPTTNNGGENIVNTLTMVNSNSSDTPITTATNVKTSGQDVSSSASPSSSSSSSSSGVETTTPVEGIREKDHPTTTVISYSEKTEISVEESVSLHVKQCGVKLASSRLDSPRLAAQSSSTATSTCWTGAIVRSPTTLSMQDPGSFICAGALIHPSVLLTTATCVSRIFNELSVYKVALGSSHLLHPINGPTADADYRDIKELIIHESYVVDGHLRINDIALVMLSEPADLTKTCTLCLPQEKADFTGRDCIVTGYSHPSDSSTMESDGILHEAHQHLLYQPNCETVLTNFTQHSFRTEKDMNGLLCASGKYSQEACFSPRDAGSPLACPENGVYVLAGSFSSGFHCGTQEMPVAYTNIAQFVDWVVRNIR